MLERSAGISAVLRQAPFACSSKSSPGFTAGSRKARLTPISLAGGGGAANRIGLVNVTRTIEPRTCIFILRDSQRDARKQARYFRRQRSTSDTKIKELVMYSYLTMDKIVREK